MLTFIKPPSPNFSPRSTFAVNSQPLIERLQSGITASDIYNDFEAFLKKSGHKKIPSKRSLYYWIKAQDCATRTTAPKPAAGDAPKSATTPQSPKPEKPKFFDSSKQYDVSELI